MISDGSRRSDRTRSQPRLLGSISIGARNAVADAWREGVLSGPNMMSSSGADPTRPCSRSASSPRRNVRRSVFMIPAACGPELPVAAVEVVPGAVIELGALARVCGGEPVPLVSSPECRKVARPTIAVISAAAPVRTPGSVVQKARNPLFLDVLGSGGSSEEGMSYSRSSQLARTRTEAATRSRKNSTTFPVWALTTALKCTSPEHKRPRRHGSTRSRWRRRVHLPLPVARYSFGADQR